MARIASAISSRLYSSMKCPTSAQMIAEERAEFDLLDSDSFAALAPRGARLAAF